jgi:hypothetical protein
MFDVPNIFQNMFAHRRQVKHINKIYTSDTEVEDMIEELSYKSFVSMVNFLSSTNKKVKVGCWRGRLTRKYLA